MCLIIELSKPRASRPFKTKLACLLQTIGLLLSASPSYFPTFLSSFLASPLPAEAVNYSNNDKCGLVT